MLLKAFGPRRGVPPMRPTRPKSTITHAGNDDNRGRKLLKRANNTCKTRDWQQYGDGTTAWEQQKHQKRVPSLPRGTGIRKNVILKTFWPHRGVPRHETLTTQGQSLMQKTTTIGDGSPSRGWKTHANLENGNNVGDGSTSRE